MARRACSVVCALLTVLLVGGVCAPAPAAAARAGQAQSPPPKAFIVVDAGTGTILLADRLHDPLPPASTAKVMTALTAVERLPADALVNVSDLAAAQPASRISMATGQQWLLHDALASLLLASANDAAYAIAETAGGSLDGFVAAMTQSADRMGMEDSTFADPAGLDDEFSFNGGPRMSAFDIAIATRNALAVPELVQWGSMRTYEFVDPTGTARSLTNHNKLLPGATRGYDWATGFKTGFTERAGHTITATATREGRTLIAVIMNTYDTYGWAVQLLEQGFATPDVAGTGEQLPDVSVSPYGARLADQHAFLALARGLAPSPPVDAVAPAAADGATTSTEPTTPSTRLDSDAIANQENAADESNDRGADGGMVDLRLLIVVVVLLLALAFVLRRHAVRRQRTRRIALQRQRAARMRSGGLNVIDGRYRTGTRVGPPVESHVRIRPDDE